MRCCTNATPELTYLWWCRRSIKWQATPCPPWPLVMVPARPFACEHHKSLETQKTRTAMQVRTARKCLQRCLPTGQGRWHETATTMNHDHDHDVTTRVIVLLYLLFFCCINCCSGLKCRTHIEQLDTQELFFPFLTMSASDNLAFTFIYDMPSYAEKPMNQWTGDIAFFSFINLN